MKKLFLLGLLFYNLSFSQKKSNIVVSDNALINEVFHLQEKLGHKAWPSWEGVQVPLLYRKNGEEVLLNHPNPPKDFTRLELPAFNSPVFWRQSKDSSKVNATFPINAISTVVMSAPVKDESKTEWVLKAVHEMFHVFQEKNITEELRKFHHFNVGNYSDTNELNFPYPFFNEKVLAIQKLEAEKVYRLLKLESIEKENIKIQQRRFTDILLVTNTILGDEWFLKFKSHMEWKEGVARYVEQKLAILAKQNYSPSQDFIKSFPNENYNTLTNRYEYNSVIAPVRFVGEGVVGRVMFYYLGMGKAYLLDQIKSDWKQEYFNKSLDELIVGEEQYLMCVPEKR